jgi:hypothetical protein
MDGVSTEVDSPRFSRMQIEPGEVMETDQPGEVSENDEDLSLEEKVVFLAMSSELDGSDIQRSFRRQLSYVKDRYPRDSLQWQQWLAGRKVWEANRKYSH